MEELTVRLDGKEYKVNVEELGNGKMRVSFNGGSYEVETQQDIEKEILESIGKEKMRQEGKIIITAPLPGVVVSINVKVGSKVSKGASLLRLVAMKMENDIVAEKSGTVKEIRVKKNESVNKDDVLVIIE